MVWKNLTGVEHLSDAELCEYANFLQTLTKRDWDILDKGFDSKASFHLARLVLEAEQILNEHDLDLERDREIYKSIRRGEWTLDRLKEWFYAKEKSLEETYAKSTLRERPDQDAIKRLLVQCLEHHYGSLDKIITLPNRSDALFIELQNLVERYR